MKFLILLLPLVCSCSQFVYYADANAKTESIRFTTLGGSSVMESAGGTRLTQNHNKSFGQANQTVATGLALWGAAYAKGSNNSLAATENANATTQAVKINESNNATQVLLNGQNAALEAAKIHKP